MNVIIEATAIPAWPPLAWVAHVAADGRLQLWHGTEVEVHDNWFGEIAWDGSFEDADFDSAEHVVGSGGRFRSGIWTFCGATSMTDRLHWTRQQDDLWVGNSLCALAARLKLELDPRATLYPSLFRSVCDGLQRYHRRVPFVNGEVQLLYMHNLVWAGGEAKEVAKPYRQRDFSTFSRYFDQMREVLGQLAENWAHAQRTKIRYQPLALMSTGYDSPASSALALVTGLREVVTITTGRSGDSDDASAVARAMGLHAHCVARDAWTLAPAAELPFLASDGKGEDIYTAGAAKLLRGRVLISGYFGSRVWGVQPQFHDDFRRGDQSGLSHCEARLHLGYLHLPVPFVLARQIGDLRRLTWQPEMQPFHLAGAYNRPIARRIVEEAGVARELFGMTKKAASVLLFQRQSFLSHASEAEFREWHSRTGRNSNAQRVWGDHRLRELLGAVARGVQNTCGQLSRVLPLRALRRVAHSNRLQEFGGYEPKFVYLFPWAANEVIARYAQALDDH